MTRSTRYGVTPLHGGVGTWGSVLRGQSQRWVLRGTLWGHWVGSGMLSRARPIPQLSEMCFEEFTTSPYEMLVLVRQFFQDIKQLLQNKETFEKDCSQVYRSACAGPRQHSSSPGTALPSASPASPAWSRLEPRVHGPAHACGRSAWPCRELCVRVWG